MAMSPDNAPTDDSRDQILAQLRIEFLDDARECLEDIADELETNETANRDAEETLLAIRRQCHGLKGMGGSFGFPTITLVAHRLEDYLARAHVVNAKIVRDIDIYCQCLLDIICAGENPEPDAAAEIIRALPAFSLFEVEDKRLVRRLNLARPVICGFRGCP